MKRTKRLTRREQKARSPSPAARAATTDHGGHHIHCVACGRHLDPDEFDASPPTATWVVCEHRSSFPTCVSCQVETQARVAAHDRTGQPVKTAPAWH